MKITREKLLYDLQHFILSGNGIIIGNPGIGKTFLLKELRHNLKSIGIPHLLLRIDQLGNGTDKTLRQELSYEGDLIDKLNSLNVTDKKAVLLIDAFDAARNEETRERFLKLIERAIFELRDSWNVVVTVRIYDAKKSQQLLDMFGNNVDNHLTQYQTKDILCRHFTIPSLTKEEILLALQQIECEQDIYYNGSDDFKKILAIPFNLWLLEKILKNSPNENKNTFSLIRSEVQLLDLFWERRINTTSDSEDRLIILEQVVRCMVENRSLSVRRKDLKAILNFEKLSLNQTCENLHSDEILAIVSSTRQFIAFSHNILFDYTTSILLLEDDPQHLENFINNDPSRPLFLRPSLTYFFTRLWYYDDSTSFWKAFWHFLPKQESPHLRLVGRLIPTNVIANETREFEQLKPIIDSHLNRQEVTNDVITLLLQSLCTLQIERDDLWIKVFDSISLNLHVNFAADLANLTSQILDRALDKDKNDDNIIYTCGQIGRRLLEWVWQEKESRTDDWYNRIGGFWAVPLVARTYSTNIKNSRELLHKVLQLTNVERFPISFLTCLTEHVDRIWEHDPKFVISIYHAVFSHQFTSEGETKHFGPIFPITTFRSQDYRMCQYRLVKHFPKFLEKKTLQATEAVIQSLNSFICSEHILRYPRESVTIDGLKEPFNCRGKTAYFVKDDSYIWDAQQSSDEPIEMANTLFDFMTELAKSEEQYNLLDSILDVFVDQVYVAFFWKRLLKIASQFPEVFAKRLFELCIAKPILLHLEVSYELGLFLENAASEFSSDNKLRQIEESILALPAETKDQENDDYLIMHRNSLLARIPMELLSTDEAKSIREKMEQENNVPENHPPVSFNIWSESYTEEKWLRDKGVDTTTPENEKLQKFSKMLEDFSDEWKKDDPTSEAAELVLPQLQMVYTIITNNKTADKKIINILWRKLIECAAILARIANSLESDSFAFCRSILLEGASHELPEPDPEHDAQFDSTGYSPFPRHEAAKGLTILAYYKPDTEILDAIETLADDSVPSVRMLTAMQLTNVYNKNPDRYWKIIYKWSEFERNHVVQECLYRTLKRLVAYNKENENKTTTVMAKLLNHTPSPERKIGTSDPFISLLMWLVIERENSWVIDFIKETYFNDPIQFSNMLTRVVLKTIDTYVVPEQLESDEGTEKVKRAINCLNEVIFVCVNNIRELCNALNQNVTEENQQKLQNTYKVIDQVISSLYYSFAHERSQSENQTEIISYDLRCRSYEEVKPLMNQVIDFADDPETGVMFASTAHYFMQLLTSFLSCNPKEVLHLAERVATSSEKFGYTLDSIAVKDIVDFVEIVLADYRHEVRDDEESLEHLLNLLDLFAKDRLVGRT